MRAGGAISGTLGACPLSGDARTTPKPFLEAEFLECRQGHLLLSPRFVAICCPYGGSQLRGESIIARFSG